MLLKTNSAPTLTQRVCESIIKHEIGSLMIGRSVKDASLGRVSTARTQTDDQSAILARLLRHFGKGASHGVDHFRRRRIEDGLLSAFDEIFGAGNHKAVDAFLHQPKLEASDDVVLEGRGRVKEGAENADEEEENQDGDWRGKDRK